MVQLYFDVHVALKFMTSNLTVNHNLSLADHFIYVTFFYKNIKSFCSKYFECKECRESSGKYIFQFDKFYMS